MTAPQGLVVRHYARDDGIPRVTRVGPDGVPFLANPTDGSPLSKPFAGRRLVVADSLTERETRYHDNTPPERFRMSMRYALDADWIELVNPRIVTKPSGPADNPTKTEPHNFRHADELVLHDVTLNGRPHRLRYRVVHQPDKYDADGNPTDVAGDPTTHVDWYFDAELSGVEVEEV